MSGSLMQRHLTTIKTEKDLPDVADSSLDRFRNLIRQAGPLKRAMVTIRSAFDALHSAMPGSAIYLAIEASVLAGRGSMANTKLAAQIARAAYQIAHKAMEMGEASTAGLGFLGKLDPGVWGKVMHNKLMASFLLDDEKFEEAKALMAEAMTIIDEVESKSTRPADLRRIKAMRSEILSLPAEAARRNQVTLLTFGPEGSVVETTGPKKLFPEQAFLISGLGAPPVVLSRTLAMVNQSLNEFRTKLLTEDIDFNALMAHLVEMNSAIMAMERMSQDIPGLKAVVNTIRPQIDEINREMGAAIRAEEVKMGPMTPDLGFLSTMSLRTAFPRPPDDGGVWWDFASRQARETIIKENNESKYTMSWNRIPIQKASIPWVLLNPDDKRALRDWRRRKSIGMV